MESCRPSETNDDDEDNAEICNIFEIASSIRGTCCLRFQSEASLPRRQRISQTLPWVPQLSPTRGNVVVALSQDTRIVHSLLPASS
jgi:hypothetical protein